MWINNIFLTGHEDLTKEELRVDFSKFAQVGGTLCIYMGMSKLEEIVEKLLKWGCRLIFHLQLLVMEPAQSKENH